MLTSVMTLALIAARPAHAPNPDVLTLFSPNEEAGGAFGDTVAGAGDVNGDGASDVIVGAPEEVLNPLDAGRAYVFGGPDGSLLYTLESPHPQADGNFGRPVSGAGDVNQDGFADLIVGAADEGIGGRAYVFTGQSGDLLFELVSPNEESVGQFGSAVAGAGDVNRDGSADLIVGAWNEDPGQSPFGAGRAYVFSGRDGSLLFELASPNEQVLGEFGISVAAAGDVNQDGFADLAVGTRAEDVGGLGQAGRAYVFSGRDGSLLLQLESPAPEELGYFGRSVAGGVDVDRDGFGDVIVGAPSEDRVNPVRDCGRAYVFSGRDGSVLREFDSRHHENCNAFGISTAAAGDVDLDGTSDVIVGTFGETPPPRPLNAGRAYIFSGQDGTLLPDLVSPNEEAFGLFGLSVAGAGDVNRDGVADVVVGAPEEDPGNSPTDAGRAYVFLSVGTSRPNSPWAPGR